MLRDPAADLCRHPALPEAVVRLALAAVLLAAAAPALAEPGVYVIDRRVGPDGAVRESWSCSQSGEFAAALLKKYAEKFPAGWSDHAPGADYRVVRLSGDLGIYRQDNLVLESAHPFARGGAAAADPVLAARRQAFDEIASVCFERQAYADGVRKLKERSLWLIPLLALVGLGMTLLKKRLGEQERKDHDSAARAGWALGVVAGLACLALASYAHGTGGLGKLVGFVLAVFSPVLLLLVRFALAPLIMIAIRVFRPPVRQ